MQKLTERRGLAVLDHHQAAVLFVLQAEAGQDFQARGRDAALVGRRVLEQDDALLFEPEAGLLRKEQVGALDDVFKVGLAVAVDQVGDVADVDRLGATAAGHKQVGLDAEVEAVAELGPVRDNLARRQLAVLFVDEHLVAVGRELLGVKARDGRAGLGEADELGAVETCGVVQDARAVNDGDRLVLAEEDLVCLSVLNVANHTHR